MRFPVILTVLVIMLAGCSGQDREITSSQTSNTSPALQSQAKQNDDTSVRQSNYPPRIVSFKFVPPIPHKGDRLRADVAVEDTEKDEVFLEYEWSLNGNILPNAKGDTLDLELTRGDVISVTVTPSDDFNEGLPVTNTVKVLNAFPVVATELSDIVISKDKCRASVVASDPDDDEIRYSLVKGPEGMTIDSRSGVITWDAKKEKSVPFELIVAVRDINGAESHLKTTLEGCYAEQ
jgi:hypothetical protein